MLRYANNTKKITIKPYADITKLMSAMVTRNVDFLENDLDITVTKSDFPLLKSENLILKNLTSIVHIENFYKMSLAFTYDASLINQIFRKYTKSIDIENIELQFFVKETCSDMINIIVGNVLSQFQQANAFQLSTPGVIVNPSNINRCLHKKIFRRDINTDFGNMSIYCILPEGYFLNKIYNKESVNHDDKS